MDISGPHGRRLEIRPMAKQHLWLVRIWGKWPDTRCVLFSFQSPEGWAPGWDLLLGEETIEMGAAVWESSDEKAALTT